MAIVISPPEQRIMLYDISWQTYEHLLADHENRSAPRFTFDRGVLEIMSPSSEHEEYNRTISLLVEILAEALNIDIRNLGSTTFKREDLGRGFEPDSCFYIQNAERISGKSEIDPAMDPPPDLVVEIDLTSASLEKFPIYAQFGVPEIWRYDGRELMIFKLEAGKYARSNESAALPILTSQALTRFLAESKSLKRTAWLRMLRDWGRQAQSQKEE